MSITIEQLLISEGASIKEALIIIDRNGMGVAFVVDSDGKLIGIATDGNIRRALLRGISLEDNILAATNSQFVSLPVTTPVETISAHLNSRIHIIPLLDTEGRPVDYASHYRSHHFPVMEPLLSGNEMNYVMECLKTNWVSSQGPFVSRFEKEFAQYIGVDRALAVSSGTTALHLALIALNIGLGDEVIVPDLTFAATINAVLYVGATPVLVDVDKDTWVLDIEQCENLITRKTKAVIAVHLYGQPVEMKPLMELAKKFKLYVVEDAAEALGSIYQGDHVGTFGDAAAFSFFGNKLITTGEGGMVVFRNPALSARAKQLRDHGMDPERRYWHTEIGYNYRLTNIQAALGVAQLEQIESFIQKKIQIANFYRSQLKEIEYILLPSERVDIRNVYWLFSIILNSNLFDFNRDDLLQKLQMAGIETRSLFYPLHTMPIYSEYGQKRAFPNTTMLSDNGLSLPSAVTLSKEEIDHICDKIIKYFSSKEIMAKEF